MITGQDTIRFDQARLGRPDAVLGRIGSGKSTLIRLALGLYAPDEGHVMLDGADVRQMHPDDIRRNAGVLLQDVHLFSGTLRENILLGREGLGDEDLLRAAEISGVADFAGTSASGYDRYLKEAGAGLSGGQKQALTLARALVTDPPLLFMDEPTSALDTMSEKQLVERLKAVIKDKTCLIVTHRTALLDLVDKILVLENGRAVALGPKDKVLAQLAGNPGKSGGVA
ncbi:MAG: ATP-binding cassette domain-containing protein [Proteobacteria bacterium]|nr:ATP-binding cassette domain-containing protein [Pseudomonadota bacterium]